MLQNQAHSRAPAQTVGVFACKTEAAHRPTRLAFRCRYQNTSTFTVHGGPMDGATVRVLDSSPAQFERIWNGGVGWAIDREIFERDFIGGAGMVTCNQQPVTEDVMSAYRAFELEDLEKAEQYAKLHSIVAMDPAFFAARRREIEAVTTGHWSNGWHRTAAVQPGSHDARLAA